MPVPLELVTLLGSSFLGGAMKIWSKSIEARRLERTYVLQALSARADIIGRARRYENKGFQWTRRTIALMAVFMPETAVFFGYAEMSRGFWFLGTEGEKIVWEQMRGLVITPLDTHLLAAIVGLYFGGSLAN